MNFYQIVWISSICHLHSLVISKSNFRKSADQFSAQFDQLIFGNQILQSPNHVELNLKPWSLTKSSYYIVPSPSTALDLWIQDTLLHEMPSNPVRENTLSFSIHTVVALGMRNEKYLQNWMESNIQPNRFFLPSKGKFTLKV